MYTQVLVDRLAESKVEWMEMVHQSRVDVLKEKHLLMWHSMSPLSIWHWLSQC